MKESSQLANRFREVILDGVWIANTNYKLQLSGLDWNTAVTKVETLNSIAILARHIHYYISGIANVLKGGTLDIKDVYSFDFPEIRSQLEWEDFLNIFWKDAEEFADLIEKIDAETLNEKFVDEKYGSIRRNIDGMIEHSYYHLGQISLIKKLIQHKK